MLRVRVISALGKFQFSLQQDSQHCIERPLGCTTQFLFKQFHIFTVRHHTHRNIFTFSNRFDIMPPVFSCSNSILLISHTISVASMQCHWQIIYEAQIESNLQEGRLCIAAFTPCILNMIFNYQYLSFLVEFPVYECNLHCLYLEKYVQTLNTFFIWNGNGFNTFGTPPPHPSPTQKKGW